jgi:AcrR family transcriptional regulator
MHDLGWDGFKVQEVAHRAGAGLATIYRRWPTKEDLVADAMRHDVDFRLDLQPGGDSRAQLADLLTHFGDKLSGEGGSVISVLAAARVHEAMRSALYDVMRDAVRLTLPGLVDDLIGPDHPPAPTVADAMLSILFLRAGMIEEDVRGHEFADEMLALVDAIGPRVG